MVTNSNNEEIGRSDTWRPEEEWLEFRGRKLPVLYVICAVPAACIVLAAVFSDSEVNVVIALPLAMMFVALAWAANAMLGRTRLTYKGWRVHWRPGLGRAQAFDCRQVSEIRKRRNRGGVYYVLRFRPGEARDPGEHRGDHSRTLRLPVSAFRDPRVVDHLLARVATVPGVEADSRTAELLRSWRRHGVGPEPAPGAGAGAGAL